MASIVVVVNDAAGGTDREALETALGVLRSRADVDVVRVGDGGRLEAALAAAEGRTLVVAGGDGSVHAAVAAAWANGGRAAGTVFGLVPLGTGNDLARGLGIPLDAAAAAEVCLDGRPRALDLAEDDDAGVVVNAAHVGIGAVAAQEADAHKDRFGPRAYPLGALLAAVREGAYDLEVTVDGRVVHRGACLLAAVANGPYVGGGTELAPTAVPDDGLLDVVVITAVSPAARVAFAAALGRGTHLERDDVRHVRGRQVRLAGQPLVHDVDGELGPEHGARTYRVRPGAWRMLVPR